MRIGFGLRVFGFGVRGRLSQQSTPIRNEIDTDARPVRQDCRETHSETSETGKHRFLEGQAPSFSFPFLFLRLESLLGSGLGFGYVCEG